MIVYSSATLGALALTFVLGVIYAIYIAYRPFPDGLTWLSVVIGVAFTIAPFGWAVWQISGSLDLGWLILVFFVASGGPMILGQTTKHIVQREVSKTRNGNHE